MDRLKLYSIGFLIAMPVYLVLYFISGLADPILFIYFLIATFFFLFTFEEKPKKQLEDPLVHYYQNSRINIYGYIMVCAAASVAFIIYLTSRYPGFKLGIVSLGMWLLLIIISYAASIYSNRNFWENTLTDYVLMRLKKTYDPHIVGHVVKDMLLHYKNEKRNAQDIYKEITKSNLYDMISEDDMETIVDYCIGYLKVIEEEEELSSDEIREINKTGN